MRCILGCSLWSLGHHGWRTMFSSFRVNLEATFQLTCQLITDDLAAVIIFEHSFYIFDKRHYLKEEQKSAPSFHVALEQYIGSPCAAAVREGVSAVVEAYEGAVATATRAYEEAVRTGVHAYQGKSSTWMAKLPFEPFKRMAQEAFERSKAKEKASLCSQAKAELTKTILEITLNNRLSRP
ncbi:hypothetical protein BDR04DRAFT_739241 [Suillus decipiens]|nr:hypothetical protein BDR04DRAFT_739241 [Suillus decipiens]